MAKDTVGLMDALGIKSAHLVGASMGGMIAQEIAMLVSAAGALADLDHVDDRQSEGAAADARGRRDADGAAADAPRKNISRASPDLEGAARRLVSRKTRRTTPRAPSAPSSAASIRPASAGSCARCSASGSRKERLAAVKAPTLVIHGTVDPLVRPEGGKDTAASIPGAKLLMIEGMGHALPIPMWPQIIGAIDEHATRHARGGEGGLDATSRRHPDHVARAAAPAGGADGDLVDVEACAAAAAW